MIETNMKLKRFGSAKRRFLINAATQYLSRQLSRGGPAFSRMLAENLVELFESVCPETERLRPGQMVWLALDQQTRAGSKNEALRPTVLTIVSEQDVENRITGKPLAEIRQQAVQRVLEEAFEQGAVLSSRDLALMFHRTDSQMSTDRIAIEERIGRPLPHSGSLHDNGTTLTHKVMIIRKVVCQHMDPADVARDTRHNQRSVDRYLKDFHRVKTLYDFKADKEFICLVTGMRKHLINEYINIIESFENHEEN